MMPEIKTSKTGLGRQGLGPALAAGGVLLVIGMLGEMVGVAWLLPSMGPTLALQVRAPAAPASHPLRAAAGHLIGLASGATARWGVELASDVILGAPSQGAPRLAALGGAFALSMTLALTHRLDAAHPPAAATTLIVALGLVPAARGALCWAALALGVVVVLGELLRRWCLE